MYSELLAFIDRHRHLVLIGHKEPDGDCVGSQLALGSFLRRRGKTCSLVSAGPFGKTEINGYASQFLPSLPAELPPGSAAIVVDCSSLSRTGLAEPALPAGLALAFIDHHRGASPVAELLCIDPTAPAVTLMVQRLIEAAGQVPNRAEAEWLLFGLCTDTGFFRHLDQASQAVFDAVGRLVAAGASPKAAFYQMSGGKSLASRHLMARALGRTEAHFGGRLLLTWLTLADQEEFGLAGRDSDLLYQLLMTIEGMEAAVVIRQETATECTVGFRSLERIDVAAIASQFGGGGHRLAAGLHLSARYDELRPRIIAAFLPEFAEAAAQPAASAVASS
ncbi:MAG TPA: bifunctional oligoribonuclease/PAP phosphatase NrnA [Spirochaetaceae bacterium]|nr:bifunctional oligoribonuclease/PAP phosphatase NrnA [Spirochaetaceae bacterium]HAW87073.1 bifunctional oligoribonuclease/PAP phosphatase NrnA [Spirochaetaceae bacterium]HAX36503.1 bifunctional oligoribonuclease/PAP phosphatase NrnA [Spirochaetaceae bacterium]HBO39797.1 bifunctional oligoribonuclease/PAP phosphatase NrnA [Spirochaetaceae bacterium]HCQ87226.1 bifunctional oligoribonuclease/PAP phosphatase NrnA [Spirochaetaceae bacterium]